MTKTGFVLANLFRKKTRTTLTLLSVTIARAIATRCS